MKQLKNNFVFSLFVSMLRKLYQENRDWVACKWALATLSYCLRAVPVWNPQWRENILSLCEWFLFLSSSNVVYMWNWHPPTCNARIQYEGTSWRASRSCERLFHQGQLRRKRLSSDVSSVQYRQKHGAWTRPSCKDLGCSNKTHHWICQYKKHV